MEITLVFIVSAFVAGVLMFLAPCTLPLVPAYLAFISGAKSEAVANNQQLQRRIILNAIAFVCGFSLIFICFGVLAGFLGAELMQLRGVMAQIGGGFIIFFGLMMLNIISIKPLLKERALRLPDWIVPGNPISAFLIGSVFALGWTPCVGPVLASVLLLATTTSTTGTGAFMLAVFSAGMAVPFLLTAIMFSRAERFINRISSTAQIFTKIGGVFLVLIGLLLLFDNFELTIIYGYKLFELLQLEGFYDLL